jgi:hypothetical protein
MAVVMIGIDPHKATHTAVAVNAAESRWASCGSVPRRCRPPAPSSACPATG